MNENYITKLNEISVSKKANISKNINIVYSELAKQLKTKKIQSKNIPNSYLIKTKQINNYNYTTNLKDINKSQNNKNNLDAKSTVNLKSTKDSSFKHLNNSLIKNKNEIEGPEELHMFYVNILQQNKSLKYKFENFEDDENYSIFIN